MENIELRQYQSSDYEAVLQLHFQGLQQYGVHISSELISGLDDDLGRIQEEYLKNGEFLIATDNEKIVGMGALRRIDSKTAEIKRMRVRQAHQGKGIGSLILDNLIEKAEKRGYKRLILDTTEKMQVAQNLYKSKGFREYKRDTFRNVLIVYYELDLGEYSV